MFKLIRVSLDFQPTLEYAKNQLEGGMILPSTLLRSINFQQGSFFTLLPKDANFNRIYQFTEGEILIQNPIQQYEYKGEIAAYSRTPTLDQELAEYIDQMIQSNSNLTCLFEDVCYTMKTSSTSFYLEKNALYTNNDQLFYLVNYKSSSPEFLEKCIKRAHANWYSLAILSEYSPQKKELDFEEIKEFCQQLKMIILGAYDSEGYIFWEKQNNIQDK